MMRNLFDSLLEPTFLVNENWQVVYVNDAAANLLESSARKVIRQKPHFLECFVFREPLHVQNLTSVVDPTPYQEQEFTTSQGAPGKVQLTLQKWPGDESPDSPPLWLVYFRDVTLEATLQRKYRAEFDKLQEAHSQLEQYSKNLEVMVAERTRDLSQLNGKMQALLDSLNEGFFIFDSRGQIFDIASKSCQVLFGQDPRQKMVSDLLHLDEKEKQAFEKWLVPLFSEMLPFEDMAALGPVKYKDPSGTRTIEFAYYPLRGSENQIEGVVLMASDKTLLVAAEREALIEKKKAEFILKMVKNRNQFQKFLQEAEQLSKALQKELSQNSPSWNSLFHSLHTLKGGAATLSLQSLAETCHRAEDELSRVQSQQILHWTPQLKSQVESIFSEIEKFENDLAAFQSRRLPADDQLLELSKNEVQMFFKTHAALSSPKRLQAEFEKQFLHLPAAQFFQGWSENLEALAEQLGKKIKPLVIHGSDLKLDPDVVSGLFQSFIHAFRNSIDHGLEFENERVEAGKPPTGELSLTFSETSESLMIKLQDDGRGVDVPKLRSRFQLPPQWSDEQCLQTLFDDQVSTKEEVTELSGRGVGLSAIRAQTLALGGQIEFLNHFPRGSSIQIQIPKKSLLNQAQRAA